MVLLCVCVFEEAFIYFSSPPMIAVSAKAGIYLMLNHTT